MRNRPAVTKQKKLGVSMIRNGPVLRSGLLICLAAIVYLASAKAQAAEVQTGTQKCLSCFSGLPVDLENMPGTQPPTKKLKRDLFYTDASGTVWKANAGDVTDGATIPDFFVPVIGDRFEPDFLPAAIIHDHYTDKDHRVRHWTDTARVFYQAMVTNSTPIVKAKLMYYAVYTFGPHWEELRPGQFCGQNCLNVVPNKFAIESDGTDRIIGTEKPSGGKELYYEAPRALPSDTAEILQIKAMIEAAEISGKPMSLDELDRQATLRHTQNIFIAVASTRR